ncbi:MAG: alkaline phosphatase family protein, partial [Chloroflexota bacterium]|nr:alkaline phosphatase family protein [Chloroflexota bacterium]
MFRTRIPSFVAVLSLALLLGTPFPALTGVVRAQGATPVAGNSGDAPVLLFAAPGMRPDVVATFANDSLPAIAAMMGDDASVGGELTGPFPGSSGTTLPTILTGTWPAEHGVVGDTFYRTGAPDFADFATSTDPGLIQADSLPQAAERAGKTVVAVNWEGVSGLDPGIAGPVVGEPVVMSQSGVLVNFDLTDQPSNADRHGVGYDRVDLRPAEGWTEAPESFSPAQETDFTIRSLDASGPNPDRDFAIYVYDSTDDAAENYDRVLVATEKNGAALVVDMASGAWASATVTLGGERDGQTAGFRMKPIDLAPDLSRFRLYHTPVSRISASWAACAEREICADPDGFEESLNLAVGAPIAVDTAPLEAGIIDAGTFVAQGITSSWQTVDALRYIVEDLGVQPDLLLLGTTFPEAVSEQFLGLLAERGGEGSVATPFASGAEGSGVVAVDREELLALVQEGYVMADEILAAGRDLLGDEASTLMVSPGEFAPSWLGVNAGQVLADAGIAESAQPANCVPSPVSEPPGTPDPEALPFGPAVKVCWSGGTAHVYVNLEGREAAGSVAEDAYEPLRDAIVAAFETLRDPATPDAAVVAEVFRKEELRDVAGADALHPSRTGDVVVTLAPPYRFDDTIEGVAIAKASPVAMGGYLADRDFGAEGFLLAAGPELTPGAQISARAIDVAPTAAFLLGVPGPFNAGGS